MSGLLEAEWMLWAKRFKDELTRLKDEREEWYAGFKNQIDGLDNGHSRIEADIASMKEEMRMLNTRIKDLQLQASKMSYHLHDSERSGGKDFKCAKGTPNLLGEQLLRGHCCPSEATTVEETIQTVEDGIPSLTTMSLAQRGDNLARYLVVAQDIHSKLESEMARAFLAGMNQHPRVALESNMKGKERTWRNIEATVQEMILDAEARRKKRRSLI
jgi:hypothetical protein